MAMFYRRRRVSRYRPRRRRLMVRRPRRVIRRGLRKVNVHSYVRWEPQDDPTIIDCNFGTSGVSPFAKNFRLNSVVNHTEFTSLYDQYKITGVKVYFDYTPDVATALAGGTPASYMPKLWIKRDYDDSSTPTITQMAESNQSRCLRFTDNRTTQSIFLRPAVLNNLFRTTLTNGYAPVWGQWLDVATDDIPHYGLKCIAQGIPSLNLGAISVRVKYYLKFKNVR